jgi:hypothetical protein
MENTIILLPAPSELAKSVRREPEVVSWTPKRRAFVQNRSDVREVGRATYVVGVNRQADRIYALANLVAVIVMAAALVMAFSMYLASFVS